METGRNEYFGQLRSCPRMLLIPESSSGRTVSFCVVGDATRAMCLALWHFAASAGFCGACSTLRLCSANNVQNCRISFSYIFKEKTKIDYHTVLFLHSPTIAFHSHLL